nr:immunoglobulin-like and fibronectin type III domain-containing protein 1 [Penaeus vannamei]
MVHSTLPLRDKVLDESLQNRLALCIRQQYTISIRLTPPIGMRIQSPGNGDQDMFTGKTKRIYGEQVRILRDKDVIVEPGRPVGPLLVSDVTNTSVTLSWNPPEYLGGGTLTCYIIEARLITCADIIKNIEIADADQTTYVVDNLETNKVYVFRVYAENETGMGDALILRTPVRVKEFIGEYCLRLLTFGC